IKRGAVVNRWLTKPKWIFDLEFTPDGKTLLIAGDTFDMMHVVTGKSADYFDGHRAPVNSMVFSADGNLLATWDKKRSLWVWDAKSGRPLVTGAEGGERVVRFGFSPDSRTLVAIRQDTTVCVWEMPSARKSREFVSGSDATVRYWSKLSNSVAGEVR